MKRFINFLLLLLLLASCGKHRTIQISAKNAATGAAYPGLHYTVGYSTTTGSGEKSHVVQSGSLDNDGLATVSLHVKRDRTYYVHVDEPENTCYNKFITMYFNSPFDEDGHFNFEFAECSYLKFHYKNDACFDENDHIEVTRITHLNGYSGFNNPAVYDGCTDYTMSDFVPVPMGYWYFNWTVTKNGMTNSYADTIFLSAGEQRYYEFIY